MGIDQALCRFRCGERQDNPSSRCTVGVSISGAAGLIAPATDIMMRIMFGSLMVAPSAPRRGCRHASHVCGEPVERGVAEPSAFLDKPARAREVVQA